MDKERTEQTAYARAGVDLAAGQRATELMRTAVQATYGPEVLSDIGNFGGLYDAMALAQMAAPVLVASTDGVGTKTKVAARLGRWETIGQDIVNHCVNDILVQGARPLFFLDYVAAARLDPAQIAAVVGGVALACRAAGCALLGGETAEMPGVYQPGEIDLVGTVVGVVEREKLIDGRRIQAGDIILGLPSSGLHTNGYSLARQALAALDWNEPLADGDQTIGEALLVPHRAYLPAVQQLWQAGVDVCGLAHITGGGLIDNPPRIFPPGLGARLWRGAWPECPIFGLIQRQGAIADAEMFHVFKMGLGMLAVIPPAHRALAQQALGDGVYVVGEMAAGLRGVVIDEQ
jgi:phosphoribosylformylglycinamidine cyclo-ligase